MRTPLELPRLGADSVRVVAGGGFLDGSAHQPGGPRPPRPSPAPRRRWPRRAVLAIVVVAAPAWGAAKALAASGDGPASVPERRPGAVVYVVQPGDTMWRIARRLQPDGDPRPLVRRLVAAHAGADLHPGDRLAVP